MKNLISIIAFLAIATAGLSQTQFGHIRYSDYGNTLFDQRTVLQRTDHANLDTLTSVFTGSTAYDTINEVIVYYNGTSWVDVGSGGGGGYWAKTGGKIHPTNIADTVNVGNAATDGANFNVAGTAQMKSGGDRMLFEGVYETKIGTDDLRVNGAGYEYALGDTVMQSFAGSFEINSGGGYAFVANALAHQVWSDGGDYMNRLTLTKNSVELYAGNFASTNFSAGLLLGEDYGYTAYANGTKNKMRWLDNQNTTEPILYTMADAAFKISSNEFYVKNNTTGNNIIKSVYDGTLGGAYTTIESEKIDITTTGENFTLLAARNIDATASRTMNLKSSSDAVEIQSLTGIKFENAYTFPLSDGNADQALTTDGNGQLSWEDTNPNNDVRVTTTTVENTTAETDIFSTTIPANTLKVGDVVEIVLAGEYSNNAGNENFRIRFKLNGTTIHTVTRTGGNVSNIGWRANWLGTIRTIGATATVSDYAGYLDNESSTADSAITPHGFDSTTSTVISATIEWDSALAGNIFNITQGYAKTAK